MRKVPCQAHCSAGAQQMGASKYDEVAARVKLRGPDLGKSATDLRRRAGVSVGEPPRSCSPAEGVRRYMPARQAAVGTQVSPKGESRHDTKERAPANSAVPTGGGCRITGRRCLPAGGVWQDPTAGVQPVEVPAYHPYSRGCQGHVFLRV